MSFPASFLYRCFPHWPLGRRLWQVKVWQCCWMGLVPWGSAAGWGWFCDRAPIWLLCQEQKGCCAAGWAWTGDHRQGGKRGSFLLQKMSCFLAIPVDLESIGQWNCWCLRVLLVLRRTAKCSRWLSKRFSAHLLRGCQCCCMGSCPQHLASHSLWKMWFLDCGRGRIDCLRKLHECLAGKYNLSSVHFSAKNILSGVICPRMTSAIKFNGLHNQVLTLSYPSLYFTLLLVLIQASEEQCVLFWLGANPCWSVLKCTGSTSCGHLAT